jgi:tetratricopeptide (TPR) repeat protein
MNHFSQPIRLVIGLFLLGLCGCVTKTVNVPVHALFDEALKSIADRETGQVQAHYEEKLALARARGDELGIAISLFASGVIYQKLTDSKKAEDSFAASLDHFANTKIPLAEALSLNHVGLIQYQNGQHERAINLADRALPIWDRLISSASSGERSIFILHRARAHLSKASSLEKLKHFNSASKSYLLAISDFRFIHDRKGLGQRSGYWPPLIDQG